eukprot:g42097.t1
MIPLINHPMFAEVAPAIDRLHSLQRAFPNIQHSNSCPLPISMDCVLPMSSPLSDVSIPVSFSQFLSHYTSISSCYLSAFCSAQGSRHICRSALHLFYIMCGTLLGSLPCSASLPYRVSVRCQGKEASIPSTCTPVDRRLSTASLTPPYG